MAKYILDVAMNIRAYGTITVEADSLADARAQITENDDFDMRSHFDPYGSGDDDFEWNHYRPEIYVSGVSVDDGETEDWSENWLTKAEEAAS